MSPLTLRFPSDELEALFRAEYARTTLRSARVTTALVMVLFAAYVVQDLGVGTAGILWPLRVLIVVILGVILALTWHPVFLRVHSWILAGSALVMAGGMLAMMAIAPEAGAIFYPGIGLVILGTFALYRILFPIALGATVLMLAAYEVLILSGRYPFENALLADFFLATALVIGVLAGWNIERYARKGFLARKGLEEERARSERLLLNVLPQPIAERLKTDPPPIADRFPEASILFADIVGFTAMSGGMEPEDLVSFLNELFTEFDRIVEKHGLEKIKTIGDAYMAVSGVPVPRPDHLERIADAALDMRALVAGPAAATKSGLPPLTIRIGIDTGPVVAGVIGEKKFIYDLWGDPVTLASRMERQGVAGEIQVTEAVRERLRGRYSLEPRGDVEIKGMGGMPTFLLLGALGKPSRDVEIKGTSQGPFAIQRPCRDL